MARSSFDIQSRVTFEMASVSPLANPASMEVALECSVFARGAVTQMVELYDYDLGAWEEVDTRAASRFGDEMVRVSLIGDLTRFIEPGTDAIKARIRFESPVRRRVFSANTDTFYWSIV